MNYVYVFISTPNSTMLFLPFYCGGCVMNCAQIDGTSKDLCRQSWMSLILEPFGPMTIPILGSSPLLGRKLGKSKENATL
jgi:hypothetical protein